MATPGITSSVFLVSHFLSMEGYGFTYYLVSTCFNSQIGYESIILHSLEIHRLVSQELVEKNMNLVICEHPRLKLQCSFHVHMSFA